MAEARRREQEEEEMMRLEQEVRQRRQGQAADELERQNRAAALLRSFVELEAGMEGGEDEIRDWVGAMRQELVGLGTLEAVEEAFGRVARPEGMPADAATRHTDQCRNPAELPVDAGLARGPNLGFYPANTTYDGTVLATQGVFAERVEEYLAWLWFQRASVVFQLTPAVEGRRRRQASYVPGTADGKKEYGRYAIAALCTCNVAGLADACEGTLLEVTNLNTRRTKTVLHMAILSWPSGGLPVAAMSVLRLAQMVYRARVVLSELAGEETTTVVHCGSGNGRTGAVLLVLEALRSLHTGRGPRTLAASLALLRTTRPFSVRTSEQFGVAVWCVRTALCESTFDEELASAMGRLAEALELNLA